MAKILIVDDDIFLTKLVRQSLEKERYLVDEAHDGPDALMLLKEFHYDLVILDWELPSGSGLDVLKGFRGHGGTTPILILTGSKVSIENKETGLDTGADDYLLKPFDPRELSARVRALLRRPVSRLPDVLTCGQLALDVAQGKLSKNGSEIKLTKIEYVLLEFFMKHPRQIFTPDDLIDAVWKSDTAINKGAVRTCIFRLRTKIEDEGQQPLISSQYGLGYRLEPP
jgi:OmpR-family two-component system manganese-sensing response regulator